MLSLVERGRSGGTVQYRACLPVQSLRITSKVYNQNLGPASDFPAPRLLFFAPSRHSQENYFYKLVILATKIPSIGQNSSSIRLHISQSSTRQTHMQRIRSKRSYGGYHCGQLLQIIVA